MVLGDWRCTFINIHAISISTNSTRVYNYVGPNKTFIMYTQIHVNEIQTTNNTQTSSVLNGIKNKLLILKHKYMYGNETIEDYKLLHKCL